MNRWLTAFLFAYCFLLAAGWSAVAEAKSVGLFDHHPHLTPELADMVALNRSGNKPFTLPQQASPKAQPKKLTSVPIPDAVWLFGSGLLGMTTIARRRK